MLHQHRSPADYTSITTLLWENCWTWGGGGSWCDGKHAIMENL